LAIIVILCVSGLNSFADYSRGAHFECIAAQRECASKIHDKKYFIFID